MRGKRKGRGFKVILLVSIIMLFIIPIFNIDRKNNNNLSIPSDMNIIEKKNNETEIIEDVVVEKVVENKGEESTTKEIKKEVSNTPKTNESKETKKSSSNSNNKTTSNTGSKNQVTVVEEQNTNTTNQTSSQTPTEITPQVDLTTIVSTNDINYGIHKGVVEFSTNAGCTKAGDDIVDIELNQVIAYNAENDNSKTVDIRYPACYQVISQANTIMGYYLNIYCESGNCNRYKSLINISNYN